MPGLELHSGFLEGFVKSWGVILASEIGDKTFFIAALLAMRNPRKQVFAGAMLALAAMTILSAAMGWAAPNLISKTYTHYGATALFFFFGVRMLYEAFTGAASASAESELEEVEKELQGSHKSRSDLAEEGSHKGGKNGASVDDSKVKCGAFIHQLRRLVSPILLEAFTLTFLAEWGDRSQIATIGLAAAADVVGVTLGGILGHALCTGAAVLGGKHLAEHIDEKVVAICGGLLFLAFGAHSLWQGPPQ
ncbi:hypothetical protein N2152v2_003397 [Parachlorella kessleri]